MSSCSGHLEARLERGLGLGLTGCSRARPGGWGQSPPPRTNLLSFFPLTLVLSCLSQLLPGARRCQMAQGGPKRSPCFTSSPNPTCLVTRGSSPGSSWPPRAGWPGAPWPPAGPGLDASVSGASAPGPPAAPDLYSFTVSISPYSPFSPRASQLLAARGFVWLAHCCGPSS